MFGLTRLSPLAWSVAALALSLACRGSATPPTQAAAGFPRQTLDFFDATAVHPDARGFQLAVYDTRGERAIFIPWGGATDKPLGIILGYHTDQDFFAAASYDAVDLTALIGAAAEGFAGGFVDEAGNWLYLVPFRRDTGSGVEPNGLAIRFDLGQSLVDRRAYEAFDLTTLPSPPPRLGWATGACASGLGQPAALHRGEFLDLLPERGRAAFHRRGL